MKTQQRLCKVLLPFGAAVLVATASAENAAVTAFEGTTSGVTGFTAGDVAFSQAQFVGGDITAFTSAPGGNNSNIALDDGMALPAPGARQELLGGDFNLNTGIFNFGNGNDIITFVFDSPVTNDLGPDLFFFEIASNFDPDSLALLINGQSGAIDGGASGNAADLGDWGALGVSCSSDFYARQGGAPLSLDDLENGDYALSNANLVQALYGVGIDLDDYGVTLGASVSSIQFGAAPGGQGTADLMMIVGIGGTTGFTDPEVGPISPVAFGTRSLPDLPATLSLVIENLGATQELTISNASITGPNADVFSIASSPGPIAPGTSGQFEITLDPQGATGSFDATLEFETNDPDESSLTSELSALVFSDPEVESPSLLSFGPVLTADLPISAFIEIGNSGATQPLNINNASLSGPDAAFFSVLAAPGLVAAGATGTFEIGFDSQGATGTFSATLEFETSDDDEPAVAVELRGAATESAVSEVLTSATDGFQILDSLALANGNTLEAAELVNVTVFSFNYGGGNPSNLIQPGGFAALPDPRQGVLEDLVLNNGIINPGAGSPVAAGTTIDDSVVGLGVRFNQALANREGTDAFFFELSVNDTQAPDPVTIALLDENDAVIGEEVSFPSSAYTHNTNQEDPTVVSVAAAVTLDALNTNTVSNGNVVNAYYNLLELDFSLFGLSPGAAVHGLFIRGAAIDPVLIAGLPGPQLDPLGFAVSSSGDDLVISWNSREGQLYNLRSDDNLQPGPAEWPILAPHQDIEATPPMNTLTIPRPAASEMFFAIEEFPKPPEPVWTEDFEAGQGDWTTGVDGAAGTAWEFGTPSMVGPAAAYSGANCFGTNLAANYEPNADVWLRSPVIDLTAYPSGSLSFFQFKDIEAMFDAASIRVLDAANDSMLAVVVPVIEGITLDWEAFSMALPAEAFTVPVKLEFRFMSDPDFHYAGWYIDDIQILVP